MAADSSERFVLLNRLADEFAERYRRGEHPSLQDYVDRHPELGNDIREFFPALVEVEQVKRAVRETPSLGPTRLPERVGGYRILREVGRGGMGVVYEAEQESLGRHVALKVLHLHAGQDPRLLERFRRESRAAAHLHHTNIVPVFEVGQQDGLCYYAMQFIRGQALDAVFQELQRLRSGNSPGAIQEGAAPAGSLAHALRAGALEPAGSACDTVAHEPTDTPVAPG